jgi:hypothetical protein
MARLSDREQIHIPRGTCLGFIKKCDDLPSSRQSRRAMQRYVMSPMAPNGVPRDVMPARYVAVR